MGSLAWGGILRVDSTFFSTIVLFGKPPISLRFPRFSGKKDAWGAWGRCAWNPLFSTHTNKSWNQGSGAAGETAQNEHPTALKKQWSIQVAGYTVNAPPHQVSTARIDSC